jgi:copper transport protein
MKRILALLILVVAAFAPAAAAAHAALVETSPAEGAVLPRAPGMIHLRFNEPVQPLAMRLFDAQGRAQDLTVTRHDTVLMASVPAGLAPGTHVLSYRVISTDGHPVAGSLTFSVGHAGAAFRQEDAAGARDVLIWLSRLGLYTGLFVGIGGTFFTAWLATGPRDPATARLLAGTLTGGALAAVLALGLQGLDALGRPLADLTSGAIWRAGLDTSFGTTVIVALLALVLAGIGLASTDRRLRRGLAALALAGVGLSLAASGHAGSAPPRWLTRPAVLIHGIAVAYWIGALAPLALVLRHGKSGMSDPVRRFSNGAVLSVIALVVTGTALALVQVPDPTALLATAYGRILAVKLGLVGGLLVIAAANRFVLTPALGDGSGAERKLARSALAELALAAMVFGLVGLWRFTPPPRAIAAAYPAGLTSAVAHLHAAQGMAEVRLTPGWTGMNQATIVLRGADGPLQAREVTLRLSNKAAGLEAIERRASRETDGAWQVQAIALPVAGQWSVEVEALISDFESAALAGEIEVH